MERLQEDPMRYHPLEASVTQIAASEKFPPSVCATGCALHLRCWKSIDESSSEDIDPGFHPRLDYPPLNNRGVRVQFVTIKGGVLVAVEGGKNAQVTVWDADTFEHIHKFDALEGDEADHDYPFGVSGIAFDGTHLALGTVTGVAKIYKRGLEGAHDLTYQEMLQPLPIDRGHPVTAISIDEGVLVVHAHSRKQTGAWRLADGKFLSVWGEPDPRVRAMPLRLHTCLGGFFTAVHWAEGETMAMTLVQVEQRQGGLVQLGPNAEGAGTARPNAMDFDGTQMVVGMENGSVLAWGIADGYEAWSGRHGGPVTAVQCAAGPEPRVVTGGADRLVKLPEVGAPPVGLVSDLSQHEPLELHFDAGEGARGAVRCHEGAFKKYFPEVEAVRATDDIINAPGPSPEEVAKAKAEAEAKAKAAEDKARAEDPTAGMTDQEKAAAMDLPGVARNPDAAPLQAAKRKCSSATCLQKEGEAVEKFKRCGGCKQRFYCSAHCQRTHWRDGHGKECKELAASAPAASDG